MEKNYRVNFGSMAIVLFCACWVFGATPVLASGSMILRVGASDPAASTAPALVVGKLCELTTELSHGEVRAEPFYQSLGIERQLAAAVKSGSVDIGYTALPNLSSFTDAFIQFDLPFLFKNDKAYIDFLETHPEGKKAVARFEKDLGVKVLMITSHGYDASVTGTDLILRNKQVKVPADIKGMKLRTTGSPVEIALMRAYGANPSPVPYSQLYSAVQQGVVDGNAVTPIAPLAALKVFEIAKYYVALGFRINLLPIYINQKKFDSMSASQQKALMDAVALVKPMAGQWAREKVAAAIKEFEDSGVEIYHPTKDEMAKWLSVRESVWKEVAEAFDGKIDLNIANSIYAADPR